MAINNVSELSATAASNADFAGVSILGSGLVSTADDSFRNLGSFLSKWWSDLGGANTVTGTGDAIAVTTPTVYTALKTGMRFQFIASAANTAAVTLNFDAIGAKAVRKISGGVDIALVAGDIPGAKYRVDLVYDATANAAAGAWIVIGVAVAAATTSTAGVVQLATNAQALAGTSTTLGLVPANLAQERTLDPQPVNLGMAASVGSSALTVALKGIDGNDPSPTNPVVVTFRNATASTGTPTTLTVTAATSIIVPSTATMAFASGVIGRLWVVAFNDAGTFRLGLVNALSGTSIMALRDGIYSSTLIAAASNSAQVIYTGTAVTSKAMTVLGYIEATEATAGTWATAPSLIKLWQPGDPLPGDTLQRQRSVTGARVTGTTQTPYDNTIPQNTEGDQYFSIPITPQSGANVAWLRAGTEWTASASWVLHFHQDAIANAIYAQTFGSPANGSLASNIEFMQQFASAALTTFKLRAGVSGAATLQLNSNNNAAIMGGVSYSYMEVLEVMA